jgi:predicted MFS family arabinose efflux permease
MTSAAPDAPPGFRYRFGFWAAGYAFLVLLACSTAPSPLYVLYARRDHFSSFMITLIYAAYAVGVMVSLIFAAHLSDVQGRRPHLLAAVVFAAASAALFIAWPALAGLFAARVLCGISVGLTMSTATAYLTELHRAHRPRSPGQRPQLTATAANLGGMSAGALMSGLLAQYAGHPLAVPYWVLLGALVIAAIMVAATPETRRRQRPRPAYRPQHMSAPDGARPAFAAALAGIFFAFAGPAVFVGLAGTFLAKVVHDTSLAMAGVSIFVVFTVGIAVAVATSRWPTRRVLATGVALEVAGLALLVVAAWLPAPSLALFIAGGGALGGAAATLLKGTMGMLVAISPPAKLGETLAGYFVSGYIGLSVPVIGVGIALRSVSPRDTLLAFAIAVAAGVVAASPILLKTRRPAAAISPEAAGQPHARSGRAATADLRR